MLAAVTRKDTSVGSGEVLIQHPVQNVGNVCLKGMPGAGVDGLFCHLPKGHIGTLQTGGPRGCDTASQGQRGPCTVCTGSALRCTVPLLLAGVSSQHPPPASLAAAPSLP